MGESTVAMAAARPEVNLLAVEVYKPGVAQTLHHLHRAGVQNVRVMRGDGVQVLTDLIAPGSLAEVWLFFPDPWPKTRHLKRRLVTPEFAALVASRLRRGGSLPAGHRLGALRGADARRLHRDQGPAERARRLGAAAGVPAADPVRAARAGRRARDLRPGVHPPLIARSLRSRHRARPAPHTVAPIPLAQIDDGRDRAAAVRTLMGGGHGHEHRRVSGHRRGDPTDAGLDLPVPVHVGVVEHGVAPAAHLAVLGDLALEEGVDQPAVQVGRPRAVRQIEAGAA